MADNNAGVHRWLRLTSPHARGADVKVLQRALNDRLRARGRKTIKDDGDYGPSTREALHTVLYLLGAPGDKLAVGATTELQRIVRNPKLRPPTWYKRGHDRDVAQAHGPDALIAWARAQVGKHEDGSSNRSPFVDTLERDFHMVGEPWCGAFVGYGLRHVCGIVVPDGIVYTPNILGWAHAGEYGFRLSHRPVKGALALFKWPGISRDSVDHVELVADADTPQGPETIGGNTSRDDRGSQNNGGEVAVKHRHEYGCVGYAIPGYQH